MTSPSLSKYKSDIENYMNGINANCEKGIPLKKTEKLVGNGNGSDIQIPTTKEHDMIFKYNYNINQLKIFAKNYKLKISGNKTELLKRLFCYLRLSFFIIKIQKIARGNLQRRYNFYHGPAFFKREMCTNHTDFLTMEEMKDVPYAHFFSYKDNDGFVYGFDIISLYNLIMKSDTPKNAKNPYNRSHIPSAVIKNVKKMLRISKILNICVDVKIKDVTMDVSANKSIELRILDLFQNMDSLGNYSDPNWFTSLNTSQLVRFMRELIDIWNYRAQITNEVKRNICPPHGDPFRNINFPNFINNIVHTNDLYLGRKLIVEILEKIVTTGIDRDSKSLGAYYVLAGLTLVNKDAAESLPWLFQSVSHI